MQRLRGYLSTWELQQRYKTCSDPVEAKRWYLLWQVSRAETVKEVALQMDIDYDYALSIVRKYNRCGPSILKDNRKLTWRSRRALRQEIEQNRPDIFND
ncbi:conserved hypothetical protein [Gloeothece citriformis PCC 7424]|uniref:Uncharacterized protein n=1 Tax=Gloeothece citriformis (strain PCC 7424) TaxID=65393 RepID=B7K9I7_GLOC7|nr:hypothetical protein [Gloeothece citriformis]ACK69955.1 conserved hypothetical protein [Gloeothece citriformis PCC 7424]